MPEYRIHNPYNNFLTIATDGAAMLANIFLDFINFGDKLIQGIFGEIYVLSIQRIEEY